MTANGVFQLVFYVIVLIALELVLSLWPRVRGH